MSRKHTNNGNNKKHKFNWRKLIDESIIIPSLISAIAFGFSYESNKKSIKVEEIANKIASVVSTQKYQVSQNMYPEYLRLKKVLEDIIELTSGKGNGMVDVRNEIIVLCEIKGTAEYAVMEADLIQYEKFNFKKNIQTLAKNGNKLPANELLELAKHTLSIIIESNKLSERITDYQNKVSNLQDDNKTFSLSDFDDDNKKNEKQDKNDNSLIFDSKEAYSIDQPIVSSEEFLGFVEDFLNSTEQIKDPDLLYYYGIMKNDNYRITVAIEMGAEVSVTETELIARYKKEYEEYNSNIKEDNPDQFNLWEFIRNNFTTFTIVITIVAIVFLIIIVVLCIALVKSLNENKGAQGTEEQNEEVGLDTHHIQGQFGEDRPVMLTNPANEEIVLTDNMIKLLMDKNLVFVRDVSPDITDNTNDEPRFDEVWLRSANYFGSFYYNKNKYKNTETSSNDKGFKIPEQFEEQKEPGNYRLNNGQLEDYNGNRVDDL